MIFKDWNIFFEYVCYIENDKNAVIVHYSENKNLLQIYYISKTKLDSNNVPNYKLILSECSKSCTIKDSNKIDINNLNIKVNFFEKHAAAQKAIDLDIFSAFKEHSTNLQTLIVFESIF